MHKKEWYIRQRMLEEERQKVKDMEDRVLALEEELKKKEVEVASRVEAVNDRNGLLEDEAVDLRSVRARAKAISRVKKVLPKRRLHHINTTIDLVNKATPCKQAAFQQAGIGADPLHQSIVEAVADGLAGSSKRKSLASAVSSIKKWKMQRSAARKFGVSRKGGRT